MPVAVDLTARRSGLTRPEGIAVMLGYGAFAGVVLGVVLAR